MRPLFDDAEKHYLAAGEPLLAHAKNLGNAGRLQHRRTWLAAIELDHQVLVAPDRHKEAAGIGDLFEDPSGIAAAQAGALEAGVRIEIRSSHSDTLAQPPARRQDSIGRCKVYSPAEPDISVASFPPAVTPDKSPSPPFRGEREGPAKREGEVGGAANRLDGPPHPPLSPGRRGERVNEARVGLVAPPREGALPKISAVLALLLLNVLSPPGAGRPVTRTGSRRPVSSPARFRRRAGRLPGSSPTHGETSNRATKRARPIGSCGCWA
jgi:hypothetical protein